MINGGPAGAGGAMPFPDPPKGQPGAIRSIAHSLSQAGHELERGEGQLRAASLTLETDWQGYAAAAYHRTAGSLAGMLRGGGETFTASASAVSGYAGELERTQSEMKALKKLYDDALHRQAGAAALASKLGAALANAHRPADQNRLNTQIGAAARQAGDALNEANGYARRADSALQSFKAAATRYQAVLEGQMPGSAPSLCSATEGTVHPGASFGLPGLPSKPGAPLQGYEGVLATGPLDHPTLPGYGTYYDGTHPAQPTNDLIDLAMLVGPLGIGFAKALGERALLAVARSAGIGAAGREAVDHSGQAVFQEILSSEQAAGAGRSSSFRLAFGKAARAGDARRVQAEIDQAEVRGTVMGQVLDGLGNAGVPLPPGAKEFASELANRGSFWLGYLRVQTASLASTLLHSSNPALRAGGGLLETILRHGR